MREIKFRGKSLASSEWVYGGIKFIEGQVFIIYKQGVQLDFCDEVIPESVGQCTGLRDKNDNWRYNHDIIKRNTGYVFIDEKHLFSLGNGNYAKAYGYDYHKDDEIIGNIHENPELLK